MLVVLKFNFSCIVYHPDTDTTTTENGTITTPEINATSPINLSFSSGYANTVSSSLNSTEGSSESSIIEEPEATPNAVTITVTDSSKTRTIVYASPIEIASISVDGERIDVGNRMIDADIPRKFSIGNATVTWKNSTITVYNFGAVMSLKIGDASFII